MKKLLSLAVIALMGAGAAMAQSTIVSSRSVSITREKEPSNTQWIVRAGINVMGLDGKGSEGTGSKAGYDFAVSFEKPISNFGFNWGMELGLTSRGSSFETAGTGLSSMSLMAHAIRFSPITFGYGYNITDDFKIGIHLGGYVSVDYTASLSAEANGESESMGIGDMNDAGMGYQRFDGGIALGGGLWYKRFNLDVTWNRGFVAIMEDSESFASNVMIRLGYAF